MAGVSNAALLAAINAASQGASEGKPSLWAAALFVVSLLLFVKTQNYVLIASTVEIEAIVHKLRVRLMDQVRRSELVPLETIGRARIVAGITRDTGTLTAAANMLAFAASGVVLLFFVGFYVAYLSLLAFAMSIVIVGMAAGLFHFKSRQLEEGRRQAAEWENRLFDRVTDLLEGFKEVRLSRPRSDDLFNDILEVSRTAANIKIRTESETSEAAGVLADLDVPVARRRRVRRADLQQHRGSLHLADDHRPLVRRRNLFRPGADDTRLVGRECRGRQPRATRGRAARDHTGRAEAAARKRVPPSHAAFSTGSRCATSCSAMSTRRPRPSSRSAPWTSPCGPASSCSSAAATVRENRRSCRVLSGLYKPDSGEIRLDGVLVTDRNIDAYRELIAAIFTDYHLFQRLYGIPDPDPAEIDRLLAEYRLLDKTRLTKGEFSTLDLSGGQRKRLALLVSLLEKRPILLLDEWTADQDPDFRRRFYDEFLPALIQAGKTVVVITHDDRYLAELHMPARKLRMDEGRFVEGHPVESD